MSVLSSVSNVSIPVGFFQALQPRAGHHARTSKWCFNPCRVFSGLATLRFARLKSFQPVSIPVGFFQALQLNALQQRRIAIQKGFNPCRVFSGLATRRPLGYSTCTCTKFQSLSGFFRPCNCGGVVRFPYPGVVFQSLSGFFRPCNAPSSRHPAPRRYVSIPVGFFQALQQ